MKISELEFIETEKVALNLSPLQEINGGRRGDRYGKSIAVVGQSKAEGTKIAVTLITTAAYVFDFVHR
ncbi:MAG: hypothetical protein VKL20_00160 [Synechocystis sp.]|nr:hypothetical protein [Synechocystis sp.]